MTEVLTAWNMRKALGHQIVRLGMWMAGPQYRRALFRAGRDWLEKDEVQPLHLREADRG